MPVNTGFVEQLFSAAEASDDAELTARETAGVGGALIRVELTGFTGTLDIQGRPHDDAAWSNLLIGLVADGSLSISDDQIVPTAATETRDYLVLNPMKQMRVSMTRSAGSISAWWQGFDHPIVVPTALMVPGTSKSPFHLEDTAHASGDGGVLELGVRNDNAGTNFGPSAGEYVAQARNVFGASYIAGGPAASDASLANANSNPLPMGGRASSATPTAVSADGDAVDAWFSRNGALRTEPAYLFQHIAAGQATTTVKSGAGVLHAISFNTAATATGTLIAYDNTAASGTIIASWLAAALTLALTQVFDLAFGTGLTLITATANGPDMTVTYR